MDYDRYHSLTYFERKTIVSRLSDIIEAENESGHIPTED